MKASSKNIEVCDKLIGVCTRHVKYATYLLRYSQGQGQDNEVFMPLSSSSVQD